jgi:hypothetical protein
MKIYISSISMTQAVISHWDASTKLRETHPSMLINFKSPPKYLAYNLEMGSP